MGDLAPVAIKSDANQYSLDNIDDAELAKGVRSEQQKKVEEAIDAVKGFKPARGKLLVLLAETLEKNSSSIIITGSSFEGMQKVGLVVAMGKPKVYEDGTKAEAQVEVGDWILFKSIGSDRISRGGFGWAFIGEDHQLQANLGDYDYANDREGFRTMLRSGETL